MKLRKFILVLLLLAVVIAPRLPKLDSFVTVDEPFWLSVGANFYYALGQREFENTVYEYHPAVTTMWLVTGAFLVYFPDFRGFGQGYFDVDKNKFDPFLLEHGKSPLELLYYSRFFQVVLIAFFTLILFLLLSELMGLGESFLLVALAASAPYFLGHSRLLNHEAMVATFVLTSVLGMIVYLERGRKWYVLFISAAAAALAQLTKSSAMAMFPVIGLILVVSAFQAMKTQGLGRASADHVKILALWILGLVVVYVALWPGMWVAPGKMLYEVYGNAFSYAFQGARLQVTQELQPSSFNLAAGGGMIKGFTDYLIWRGTPVMWAGNLLTVAFLFMRAKDPFFNIFRKLVLYLSVTAFMFILLFSVAQGRNSAHYIMTSHVSMDITAGLGWCALLAWLGPRWRLMTNTKVRVPWITALVILQLMSALSFYPYYYTYSNPIMVWRTGQLPISDYGEGFEQAAAYLAQKADSESLKVFAFRGRGPFSFFFPGETIILNPLFTEEPGMGSMLERLAQADYLVINDALGPRTERTALFVQALNAAAPEHNIQIKAVQTIHIYRVADLPPSFYETISK